MLLGPLRAVTYVCLHGALAAVLGSLWRLPKLNWWAGVAIGAVVRMAGQFGYLVFSSFTMNENLFAVMLANVHAMLDQISAATGASGSPSPVTVISLIVSILLVNGAPQ